MSTHQIGFEKKDYTGAKSTLCTGCGHDSITSNIVSALFQSGISPFKVAKLSGIGCSSKTPAYFLSKSHGFNSLHGRMAPLAIGAKVAHKDLTFLGVSGDGDSASIGLGGFVHLIRRNLPMVYIIENNGVYGLTKGQFSATADPESTIKSGEQSLFATIDLCALALQAGATFVARSFSGDAKQLIPLIDTALRHNGTAIIDVISPCITFANHEGSTKSYSYVKEHKVNLQELGFIQPKQEIKVDYAKGETQEVSMADGSTLWLKKLDSDHDHTNKINALELLAQSEKNKQILTGLFYLQQSEESLIDRLNLCKKPLSRLQQAELQPDKTRLQEILKEFE